MKLSSFLKLAGAQVLVVWVGGQKTAWELVMLRKYAFNVADWKYDQVNLILINSVIWCEQF